MIRRWTDTVTIDRDSKSCCHPLRNQRKRTYYSVVLIATCVWFPNIIWPCYILLCLWYLCVFQSWRTCFVVSIWSVVMWKSKVMHKILLGVLWYYHVIRFAQKRHNSSVNLSYDNDSIVKKKTMETNDILAVILHSSKSRCYNWNRTQDWKRWITTKCTLNSSAILGIEPCLFKR